MENDPGKNIYLIIGKGIKLLGVLILFSAVIINPWVGKYWRGVPIIRVHGVMFSYFIWSLLLGTLVYGCGLYFPKVQSPSAQNIIILVTTLSLIIVGDRMLLAKYGRKTWIPDQLLHYKNRPNAIKVWGKKYNYKTGKINRYGYYDDDFPIKKPDGEFRMVVLGDSITMGHGVTPDETFSTQLEHLLAKNNRDFKSYQVINTGVQGYSTFQEYYVLKDAMRFDPDVIAIGFCMNDVTEPFVVNRKYGGTGLDYHGVVQTSSYIASYIINETGYGRFFQNLFFHSKSLKAEKRKEIYNVKYMASHSLSDKRIEEAWREVLSYMKKIVDIGSTHHIKVLLMIFPHTFQLKNSALKVPEKILKDFARGEGIDVIDFTDIFEKYIFRGHVVDDLIKDKFTQREIHNLYSEKISRYFLDKDHYTVEGNQVVARELYNYLIHNVFARNKNSM